MPTQHQYAKLLGKDLHSISYRKKTFSSWIDGCTNLGQNTIYLMIELYEKLKDQPDYEPPKGMTWRECLAILTGKEKPQKQIEDEAEEQVIDIVAEKIEEPNASIIVTNIEKF